MIKEAIIKLSKKKDLTYQEAEQVMNEIMEGKASDVQMSAYLTALSLKGETIDEITASASGMRAHCIKLLHDMDVLEIVGTGGDGSNSFNISTTAALVIAAGGVPVAKHGNRAASSKCGAADVLEALGVKINLSPEKSAALLKENNICFLFAQNYHIAMKYVAPIRKELGIRTVFNILGPLSNPAGANMELMGVYEESLVEPLAQVMAKLGVHRGMVVYGQDKLDEISMSSPTSVCEIKDGWFQSYEITPEQFGYTRCSKEDQNQVNALFSYITFYMYVSSHKAAGFCLYRDLFVTESRKYFFSFCHIPHSQTPSAFREYTFFLLLKPPRQEGQKNCCAGGSHHRISLQKLEIFLPHK